MDSGPRVDHDDQEWFASRHKAHLNQKARQRSEEEAKPRVLYLSWRDLSWIGNDHVSTIHNRAKGSFYSLSSAFIPDFATALEAGRHLEIMPPLSGREGCPDCHPERSEGSGEPAEEILRCAQDDRPSPCKREAYSS